MAEFCMISYLATIAFGAKQDKCLIVPEKYSPGFVFWRCSGRDPAIELHISFILSIHNSKKLYASILPLCMIRFY